MYTFCLYMKHKTNIDNLPIKTRVVGAAAYLLLALMDHFEIDVVPPSSDLERPFEP